LIRNYEGCDGGKTGFTNDAGFCLAATANRNHMRMISVVIGEETSNNRFEDVKTMFDYAFANYQNTVIFEKGKILEEKLNIKGGKDSICGVYPERDVCVFSKRGEKLEVVTETSCDNLKAPIKNDEKIGELIVFKNGIEVDRVSLLSANDIEKANIFDWLKKISKQWNDRNN
jgi:D-alanyl-D-alanine carboxypeptidase (penicillin-binding protein 5/6)